MESFPTLRRCLARTVLLEIVAHTVHAERQFDYSCGVSQFGHLEAWDGSIRPTEQNISKLSPLRGVRVTFANDSSNGTDTNFQHIRVMPKARLQIAAEANLSSKGVVSRAPVHIIPDTALLPNRCSQQASNDSLWLIVKRNGTKSASKSSGSRDAAVSSRLRLVNSSDVWTRAILKPGRWRLDYVTCGREGDEFKFSIRIRCRGRGESNMSSRRHQKSYIADRSVMSGNMTSGVNKTGSDGTRTGPLVGVLASGHYGFFVFAGPAMALIALIAFAFRRRFWRLATGKRKLDLQGIRADFDLAENPLASNVWGEDDDDEIISGPLVGRRIGSPCNRTACETQMTNAAADSEYFSLVTPR